MKGIWNKAVSGTRSGDRGNRGRDQDGNVDKIYYKGGMREVGRD